MSKARIRVLSGGLSLAILLAGCGGGDSSDSGNIPVVTAPTPTPTPTPTPAPSPAPTNVAPAANQGRDQNVLTKTSVTLDASDSVDDDGDLLTYNWILTSRPTGSVAVLSSLKDAKPTFTADLSGTYIATLITNDGKADSKPAIVTITAGDGNVAPVANAGSDKNVITGASVALDGSRSSDANGNKLTYSWRLYSRPSGSDAFIPDRTIVNPKFTPDISGRYVLRLNVSDGSLNSEYDSVTVTASSTNSAPVSDPGKDRTVNAQSIVQLDGRDSSDANGNTLRYSWRLTSKPAGSGAALTTPTQPVTNFTTDVLGTYVATLIVNDGLVDSVPATVAITAATAPIAPPTLSPTLSFSLINVFTNQDEPSKLPYTVDSTSTQSCIGTNCSPITIDKFRLVAKGGSFTIQDLSAANLTAGSTVVPSFRNLSDGLVIADGQTVNFDLRSGLTDNKTVTLRYKFSIKETGAKFSYTVKLTTN